jgi:hypothetical protein
MLIKGSNFTTAADLGVLYCRIPRVALLKATLIDDETLQCQAPNLAAFEGGPVTVNLVAIPPERPDAIVLSENFEWDVLLFPRLRGVHPSVHPAGLPSVVSIRGDLFPPALEDDAITAVCDFGLAGRTPGVIELPESIHCPLPAGAPPGILHVVGELILQGATSQVHRLEPAELTLEEGEITFSLKDTPIARPTSIAIHSTAPIFNTFAKYYCIWLFAEGAYPTFVEAVSGVDAKCLGPTPADAQWADVSLVNLFRVPLTSQPIRFFDPPPLTWATPGKIPRLGKLRWAVQNLPDVAVECTATVDGARVYSTPRLTSDSVECDLPLDLPHTPRAIVSLLLGDGHEYEIHEVELEDPALLQSFEIVSFTSGGWDYHLTEDFKSEELALGGVGVACFIGDYRVPAVRTETRPPSSVRNTTEVWTCTLPPAKAGSYTLGLVRVGGVASASRATVLYVESPRLERVHPPFWNYGLSSRVAVVLAEPLDPVPPHLFCLFAADGDDFFFQADEISAYEVICQTPGNIPVGQYTIRLATARDVRSAGSSVVEYRILPLPKLVMAQPFTDFEIMLHIRMVYPSAYLVCMIEKTVAKARLVLFSTVST